jgi:SnoaL-like domain
VDYSTAIDQRRFDDLDKVFTPDAYIDFWATKGHLSTAGLPTALLKGSPCDLALFQRPEGVGVHPDNSSSRRRMASAIHSPSRGRQKAHRSGPTVG